MVSKYHKQNKKTSDRYRDIYKEQFDSLDPAVLDETYRQLRMEYAELGSQIKLEKLSRARRISAEKEELALLYEAIKEKTSKIKAAFASRPKRFGLFRSSQASDLEQRLGDEINTARLRIQAIRPSYSVESDPIPQEMQRRKLWNKIRAIQLARKDKREKIQRLGLSILMD